MKSNKHERPGEKQRNTKHASEDSLLPRSSDEQSEHACDCRKNEARNTYAEGRRMDSNEAANRLPGQPSKR